MTADRSPFKTFCITVGGTGFAPIASGTWGSLPALPIAFGLWIALSAVDGGRLIFELALVALMLISCVLSVVFGEWAVARFGRKDPKQFVLDEFAGQFLALLFLPLALTADASLTTLAVLMFGQFLAFRFFDIIKPPPARQLEALPAGWGILLDDLFAAIYANLAGQLLWRFTPAASMLGLDGVITWGGGS